jgi:hypothetical protein
MKKSSLTTAVVAGIVGVAGLVSVSNAVNINPDGLGQALIYPYYTVNKSNNTLISVVNTTDETKAVKVRFMEGRDSQEVLDFNLYLSPFDVWTAAIVSGGPEGTTPAAAPAARVFTSDTSCTVPALGVDPIDGQPGIAFRNFQYANGTEKVTGPWALSRTREGHIEMIEMGVLEEGAGTLAFSAKHVNGVPRNCGALVAAWDIGGGIWTDSAGDAQMNPPSGGLFGGAEIVNAGNGQNISYNADAIEGFFVDDTANLHTDPGSLAPSLADAQTAPGTAEAIVFANGTLYQFPFTGTGAGLRAVSAVFMHNEIYNEYSSSTSANLASESEWVITFPTKRLHIQSATAVARLPFRSTYNIGNGGACEPVAIRFWNREEQTTSASGVPFSPPQPGQATPSLCFEAQVVTFNQTNIGDYITGGNRSGIFGSYYARNINTSTFTNGWARITLGDQNPTSTTQNFLPLVTPTATPTQTTALVGLPVTGFWASNFAGTGAGVLANYSLVHKHRADRVIADVIVSLQGTNPVWTPVVVPASAQ